MLTWSALAVAVLLVPGAHPARVRAQALAGRGRLRARTGSPARRRASLPSWAVPGLCLAVAAVTGVATGAALALTVLVVSLTATALLGAAARGRRRDRAAIQLAAAVTLMAAELEAGTSPAAAVLAGAEACPSHEQALRAMAARVAAGDDPVAAAHSPPAAPDGRDAGHAGAGTDGDGDGDGDEVSELAALAHAWRVAVATGAPLAEVWTRVARELADRIEQRRAVAIALAGARSSAALLAVLPVVGIALGTAMQAEPVRVLFTTATGHAVLLIGVCLDAAGLGWTHWLTARAEAR